MVRKTSVVVAGARTARGGRSNERGRYGRIVGKVLLDGIDAPERKQAYGLASSKHLASIVAGQQVTVEYQKRDRYRRIVGYVIVDGQDVNLVQVKAEMAWFYRYYQRELSPEDRQLYTEAENKARDERLGLWRENNPIPPWEHRRLYG